jgi:hypothetical protein
MLLVLAGCTAGPNAFAVKGDEAIEHASNPLFRRPTLKIPSWVFVAVTEFRKREPTKDEANFNAKVVHQPDAFIVWHWITDSFRSR